jgi:uncharacterized protein
LIALITVQNETFRNIPTLHVVKANLKKNNELPTVFFLHGYTSAKEHNLPIAYLLAEKGFRVILPDAIHHGEREGSIQGKKRDALFWNIVLQSIQEIKLLKEELKERSLLHKERIGISGTSMGAITSYGALSQYNWIDAAVAYMGTAYFQSFVNVQIQMLEDSGYPLDKDVVNKTLQKLQSVDLSQRFESLKERPLFIWHGEQDEVVPFDYSNSLYKDLQHYYKAQPENLKFLSEPKTAHKVSRAATLAGVNWFSEHLLTEQVKATVW